ncbi:EAL domain-containing protein [Roseibium polysiphoniae]|uniref:EAL domain-containing protein n=1 Tax=Roseibium polysiphoniae TaxID=2571221 RepID=A0A944CB24_9HYPH|nr:EAL domain-containing protein [Roseibium polysiphoniae]MBS8258963.1 EAL domain-containing protein [Roseibium polysiphoniae]
MQSTNRTDAKISRLKTGILDLSERFEHNPYFIATHRSLALSLPLIMLGAIALLLRHPPFPAFGFLKSPHFTSFCDALIDCSFGIAALVILIGFSITLANLQPRKPGQLRANSALTTMVVVACFFVIVAPDADAGFVEVLSIRENILTALATSALACWLLFRLSQIRVLRLPVGAFGHDPLIGDVFLLMPAAMATIVIFCIAKMLLMISIVPGLEALFASFLVAIPAMANDQLISSLLYEFSSQVLWFFGLHGPNILSPVHDVVFDPAADANALAARAGTIPPYILTTQFFDFFTRMGGSGSTLCLILALVIAGKTATSRKFAFIALIPALFNVNEPLMYGIPLVLNPLYVIPLITTPLVQAIVAYNAIDLHLVPRITEYATWTTPVFASGYLITGSIAGSLLQVVGLVIGTLIYIPFVRLSEQVGMLRNVKLLETLNNQVESQHAQFAGAHLLEMHGAEGRLATTLARDLDEAVKSSNQLFLEYQPQINVRNREVSGTEALLRWEHPSLGRIAPPLIIALAEESGYLDELGFFILREACTKRAEWSHWLAEDCTLAVNVSPRQLSNPDFCEKALHIIRESGLTPKQVELEITETSALLPDKRAVLTLHELRIAGVRIALDDFGMGHTSIHYLKELPLDTIKIDRSLTNVALNKANELIVKSILELGESMSISVMVEGIEEEEQLERFMSLGCTVFQGYLFSKPMPAVAFPSFAQSLYMEDAKQRENAPA